MNRPSRIFAILDRSPGRRDQRSLVSRIAGLWLGETATKSYISVVDRLVVSGTNFLTLAIVGRVSGLSELGVFALAWTVLLTTIIVVESLVATPFTVFVGQSKDDRARRSYAGIALAQTFALAVAGMAGIFAAALVLEGAGASATTTAVCWALMAAVPAIALREFARRFMFVQLNSVAVLMIDLTVAILQFGGLGALWYFDQLTAPGAVMVIAAATGVAGLLWLVRNLSSFATFDVRRFFAESRRHLSFGRWICAGQFSDFAVTHGIAWLVASFAGVAATGLFAACNSLVLVINPLVFGIGSILLPRTARANHEHGHGEVGRIVWKTTAILFAAVGSICLGVALLGEFLVSVFYSIEAGEGVRQVVILLALANFFGAVAFGVDNGLTVINRPDVNFAASAAGLVVTLAFAVFLIGPYGAAGAAVSVLSGTIVATLAQFAAFIHLVGAPVLAAGPKAAGEP